MEKPFDVDDLKKRLEGKGLPMAEDTLQLAANEVLDWVAESGALHENSLVKALVPSGVGIVKPLVQEQLDKFDGVQGQ